MRAYFAFTKKEWIESLHLQANDHGSGVFIVRVYESRDCQSDAGHFKIS